MKSKKFRIDRRIQKLADELEKIKKRYLHNLWVKQHPLFKEVATLNAKAKKLKYNRTGDPCPDCGGTGQRIEYTHKRRWWSSVWKVVEKKVPCKYCMED